jgi:hypothetical protein
MDTQNQAASAGGEHPPQVQSQPAVGEPAVANASASSHDAPAKDAASTASLLSQDSQSIPPNHDASFAAINHIVNGNGALPPGVVVPPNQPLANLSAPNTLQAANGHTMSAGMVTCVLTHS